MTHTLSSHPELKQKLEKMEKDDKATEADFTNALFGSIPDNRIEKRPHLSYFSHAHWAYAGVAVALFFAATWFFFEPGSATLLQWLTTLAVTSTVGIISLIAFNSSPK